MNKVSMSYLFSSSRHQKKCVILIWTIDDVTNFKIYLRSTSKAMVDRGEKKEKTEIQKSEYLENEISSLDGIKNIFHSF